RRNALATPALSPTWRDRKDRTDSPSPQRMRGQTAPRIPLPCARGIISRPLIQENCPSRKTPFRSAARQSPAPPLRAGRRAASATETSPDLHAPAHRQKHECRYKLALDARSSREYPAPPPPAITLWSTNLPPLSRRHNR